MVKNFKADLIIGQKGEQVVKSVLESLTDEYTFAASDDQHKGDIIATNTASGQKYYLEVKTDSRIGETGNILCEEEVFYYDSWVTKKGFMYSDYEYFCILSRSERKIYIIDFKVLKANYLSGWRKRLEYTDQESICYFIKLDKIKQAGGLLYEINY